MPATSRNTPLNTQERYDNVVFPRGGGPGSLTGRGGGPNAALGGPLFEKECASCHKFGTVGKSYGPDLTTIGTTMLRRDLLRAIFFPDEKVAPKYQTTVITTRDSRTIRGLVVSETGQTVVLKTAEAADPVTIQKAQIVRRTSDSNSVMPSDLPDKLGDQNITHIVAYLMAGK